MTRISSFTLDCPNCYTSFSIMYNASINAWLSPETLEDFYNGQGYYFECPSCQKSIRLVTTIIINTRQGMFNISTDASMEEKRSLFRQFGLLDENNNFKNPQAEWLRDQYVKMNAPEDTLTQKSRQRKILEEINDKLNHYKELLKNKTPLDESESKSFDELKIRWEMEQKKMAPICTIRNRTKTRSDPSVLFQRLWEDLVNLKGQLNELK